MTLDTLVCWGEEGGVSRARALPLHSVQVATHTRAVAQCVTQALDERKWFRVILTCDHARVCAVFTPTSSRRSSR